MLVARLCVRFDSPAHSDRTHEPLSRLLTCSLPLRCQGTDGVLRNLKNLSLSGNPVMSQKKSEVVKCLEDVVRDLAPGWRTCLSAAVPIAAC